MFAWLAECLSKNSCVIGMKITGCVFQVWRGICPNALEIWQSTTSGVEICHDQSLVYSAIRLACVQENCQAEEFVYPMGVKMIAGKVKMQKLFLNDNIFRNNAKSLVCTVGWALQKTLCRICYNPT